MLLGGEGHTEGARSVGQDAADEAQRVRFRRLEAARSERELAKEALVADHLGQALQRADVGSQADVDLLLVVGAF